MAEKDNIEDQLQHLFEDHEMSADNRVWENIEAELTKSKKRPVAFWWTTGLAASLAGGLAIWATQLFFDPTAINQTNLAQSVLPQENIVVPTKEKEESELSKKERTSADQTVNNKNVTIAELNRPVVKSSSSFSVNNTRNEATISNTLEIAESAGAITTTNVTITPPPIDNLTSELELEVAVLEPPVNEEATEEVSESVVLKPFLVEDSAIESLIPKKDESKWILAAYYGTMPPGQENSSEWSPEPNSIVPTPAVPSPAVPGPAVSSSVVTLNPVSTFNYIVDPTTFTTFSANTFTPTTVTGVPTTTYNLTSLSSNQSNNEVAITADTYLQIDVKHEYSMPFISGMVVGYQLGNRLSIESGLQIIRVTSTTTSYEQIKNTLTYLGLPVQFRYKVMDKTKMDLYASGGMTFEFGLKYTQKYLSSEIIGTTNPGIHSSLNLGVGNDIMLSKKASFFIQPGISVTVLNKALGYYHIADIRSVKRLWPNLNTGIRFYLD